MVAGALDAELHQRGDGQADGTAELDGRVGRMPARNGKHTVRIECREEGLPALDGVEPVLRQGERPGAGGCPGVDHAHFDQIELLLRPREPAAAVVDHEAHPGKIGDSGIGPQLGRIRQQVDDHRVQVHAGHVAESEQVGRQHVAPAADPDDGRASAVAHVVGEIGDVGPQVFQDARRPVEAGHHRAGHAVDCQAALLGRGAGGTVGDGPHRNRGPLDGAVTATRENEFHFT